MTTKLTTTEGLTLSKEDLGRVGRLAEEGRVLAARASALRKEANRLAGDASKKFAEAGRILRGEEAEEEDGQEKLPFDGTPLPVSMPLPVLPARGLPDAGDFDEAFEGDRAPKGPPVDAMRLEVQMPGEPARAVTIVTHAPEGDVRFTPEGRGCSTFRADELAVDPMALELAFRAAMPIFPARTGNGPDDETPPAFRPELDFGHVVRAFVPPVGYAAVRCANFNEGGVPVASYTLWPIEALDDWPKERKTFANFVELRKHHGGGAPETIDLDGLLVDVDGEPCVFGHHMERIYVTIVRPNKMDPPRLEAAHQELNRELAKAHDEHPVPKIEPLANHANHKKAPAPPHPLDVKYGLNIAGVYTKPKKVQVPVPAAVKGYVTFQVAQGADGRWRGHPEYGLRGTGVGSFGSGGLPGAGGPSHDTETACLVIQADEVLHNLDKRGETPRARKLLRAVADWIERSGQKLEGVRYLQTPKPKAAAPGATPLTFGRWFSTFRQVYDVERTRTKPPAPALPDVNAAEKVEQIRELFGRYPKLRPSDAARGYVASQADKKGGK